MIKILFKRLQYSVKVLSKCLFTETGKNTKLFFRVKDIFSHSLKKIWPRNFNFLVNTWPINYKNIVPSVFVCFVLVVLKEWLQRMLTQNNNPQYVKCLYKNL